MSHKYGVYSFALKHDQNIWFIEPILENASYYSQDLAKPYTASITAATTLLHASTDNIVKTAYNHVSNLPKDAGGRSEFSSSTASHNYHTKGSELWTDGASNTLGSLWTEAGSGVGIFMDSGIGKYTGTSTYTFPTVEGTIYSEGQVITVGAGFLGYWSYDDVQIDHALHLGWQRISFTSPDIDVAQVDTDRYFAALATGLSYTLLETDAHALSTRTGLTYTHTQKHELVDSLEQDVEFSTLRTWRTDISARYAYTIGAGFSAYTGAGLHWTFLGEQKIHIDGQRAPDPELTGTAYMGEFGLRWQDTEGFSALAAVQGFTGFRQGYEANLSLEWSF